MGDTIYIPTRGAWWDTRKVHIGDLFPGKTVKQADEIMARAASEMERFLSNHGQNTLGIVWINQLDMDENPEGKIGFFRLYPKLP